MSNAREFADAFMQIQRNHHWAQPASPVQIVEEWEDFVESCEQGYTLGLAEYTNDRMVRDRIEVLLSHPDLSAMEQMAWFRSTIAKIDERFRALLEPLPSALGGVPWWESGIPRRAGSELAEDIKADYDVEVKRVD